MAYDEYLADRVRSVFMEKRVAFEEKKMMGGLAFMVDDKMCCGVLFSKKHEVDVIMARIGEEAYEAAKDRGGCQPMDFTGRPMRGYAFVTPEGFDDEDDLAFWVQKCIDFNPFAKSSKRKKK